MMSADITDSMGVPREPGVNVPTASQKKTEAHLKKLREMQKLRKLNKENPERKKGSGRPKGSKSFTNLTLQELTGIVGHSKTVIPVSRVWLEKTQNDNVINLRNELNKAP